MNENIRDIEKKIFVFTRKYYFKELLIGLFYTLGLMILLGLALLLIEYFSYLSVNQRTIIFFSYLIFLLIAFIYFIIKPLLGYFSILKGLSKNKINSIIVNHFPDIKDHLWNLFELNIKDGSNLVSYDLVKASIQQRIDLLSNYNFTEAIDFKIIGRILLLFSFLLTLSISLLIFWPNLVRESSKRLINFKVEYLRPSPYIFQYLNDINRIPNGDDFIFRLKITSDLPVPSVKILIGDNLLLMNKDSLNFYSYKLKNINNSIDFRFVVDNFYSKIYSLDVVQKPILSSYSIDVKSPIHTGVKDIEYSNITDLTVLEGSNCIFKFDTYATDSIIIISDLDTLKYSSKNNFTSILYSDKTYKIGLKNTDYYLNEFLSINVKVLKDQYPVISLNQVIDSTNYSMVYFKGYISDDYGFKSLNFYAKHLDSIIFNTNINIYNNLNSQDFYYAFDFSFLKQYSSSIDYYFVIEDNDVFNGYKKAQSEVFVFKFPDFKDLMKTQDENLKDLEDKYNKSQDLAQSLKNEILDLQKKMINSELTDWDKNNVLKNINSKKNNLENLIKQIETESKNINDYSNSFTELSSEIIKKQEQIQELLNDLFSNEMKNLLEQFNKILSEMNKDKINEQSERLELSLDDLNKQLDKNLELFKRLDIEKRMEMLSNQLDNILDKHNKELDKLNDTKDLSSIKNEQNKLKDELSELKSAYNDVLKKNEELDEKFDFFSNDNEFNTIDNEFNNTQKSLNENDKKKSSQSMNKNKSNIENLAFNFDQMRDNAFQKQNMENIEDLIQILDNLIVFSFDQERIFTKTNSANFDAIELNRQKQLVSNFNVIKDSLYSLSSRLPSLSTYINKEIVKINDNFFTINNIIQESFLYSARVYQQNIVTSANNLALFMSELLKELQQQMANSTPGNQNCQKPGNNPNPNSMGNSLKSLQQSLQKQLETLEKMARDGQSGKAIGAEQGKALAEQEKMQRMLQQLMNNGNVGSKAHETLKEADQLLNRVREDILRNNVTSQTLNREKQILTRLLEAENAENEREQEEKRQSTTALKQIISESANYFDKTKSNDNFEEKLIKQKLIFNRHYQNMYQLYMNSLDSINGKGN